MGRSNRPVIIDFSAEWCSPCRELQDVTFHHPEVVAQAERHFTVMLADEIVVEGQNVSQQELEISICRHLDLPAPAPPQKGLLGRIFGKD